MNSTMIQQWQVAYVCAALLFAAATLVAGDHLRAGDPPAASTRCAAALTAGALWPVMVVGLVQLWTIDRLLGHGRAQASPAVEPARVLTGAGSR